MGRLVLDPQGLRVCRRMEVLEERGGKPADAAAAAIIAKSIRGVGYWGMWMRLPLSANLFFGAKQWACFRSFCPC